MYPSCPARLAALTARVHLAVHHSELRMQRKEGRSKSWQTLIPRGEVRKCALHGAYGFPSSNFVPKRSMYAWHSQAGCKIVLCKREFLSRCDAHCRRTPASYTHKKAACPRRSMRSCWRLLRQSTPLKALSSSISTTTDGLASRRRDHNR